VVVTGAAGGIGGALVRRLVAAGASTVVATDLDLAPLEALAEDVDRVRPRRLDVADEAATVALVDEVEREVGPVDIWFANAGFAEWMAITYADKGIKVSCICPGAVDTPMLRGVVGDADQASARIGAGDVLPPEEAAARIVAAVAEDRFLIYTHPELQKYVER